MNITGINPVYLLIGVLLVLVCVTLIGLAWLRDRREP